MSIEMNRRSVLRTAIGVSGAAAMAPLLSACGTGGSVKAGGNTKAGLAATLPTHVPNTSIKADIPTVSFANGASTDPGFLSYPANPVATVSGIPGSGGSYTAVTPLWGTIPSPGNQFYQAVNKALGTTLTMQPANGVTYNTAIPTLTAAQKLPDWVQLPTWWNAAFEVGELAGTQLADLTPYLAGDKIKAYPNLAALPTGAWECGVWDNKLYGIPSFASGTNFAGALYYREDVFATKGIQASSITSAADMMALGKELTDAKAGVWAFDDIWTYFSPTFGVPSKFRVDGGKLVHRYETAEILEALNWHYQLAKSGYMHPSALAGDSNDAKTRFYGGKVLVTGDGTGAWNLADAQSGAAANKAYRRGALPVIAADGSSTPSIYLGSSASEMSYLSARLKPAQIKELLAVANYLAAPWGSLEYTLINYGVEGVDYTMVDGVPTATATGQKNVQQQTYPFLATCQYTVTNPGAPQITQDYCAWVAAAAKYAYKPVFWNMNIVVPGQYATADAAQAVEDTITSIYHGLKPVSAFQDAVSTWKKNGGDAVVAWYQSNILDKFGSGQ
ncbi:hypothetical protein [Streptacidiphilus sp. P02-A3a]|uniref:hypothetical protein n=1 Tax=Streptacidiphilus sp. P02-A3a TaxID=2704468 RepID=UPI0015FA6DF5|nr:hypothetical protein [Streptacidiphilus sp. P02-A3a]QMU69815.1 hypothetical protein GXP74_17765 [Streptacidiphilus sp. P02-A3a]